MVMHGVSVTKRYDHASAQCFCNDGQQRAVGTMLCGDQSGGAWRYADPADLSRDGGIVISEGVTDTTARLLALENDVCG
ncbi:hypothetical protein PR202_gb15071 [Eleusine coracana subsp. coracana]|uniref:Uncharacterized protein n=1 Tax=Eleusine coracana subsp. coracana TaxID=191504 RepID=A0AAV5EXB2_ELECO|nr:hypothetical protein PR202_gb15071 [Eleusine coracana subsp. coracana]